MPKIQELYQAYSCLNTGDLSSNQKKQMYSLLGSMKPEDISTLEEHKQYVELVQKLRQASMEDMELFGQRFLATLKSLLSVGEDGVYTNRLRFLYELIQNVDDCDYSDVSDCNLDIQFRYENEPGRIILRYNETGFTPENVFAITGIAEKSKNISADKIEIGEKGIGFKSVFGIARKVLIESGLFAFELYADNFTVPVPRYDSFEPVKGTRLTLEMTADECRGIYRRLVEQYMTQESILNQNPILFLNKLTHLKMHFDGFRYIEFDVQRTVPEQRGELLYESNAAISVDMKDYINGTDRAFKNEVICYRYTMPITYGREECVARYGEDTAFNERKHNLVAVFPILPDETPEFHGVLYSFLPTQVKTTAPIILHVPYKLGGSREFVDSCNNDAWFTYTNQKLVRFLELVYLDLAQTIKQKIIRYIPNKHNYFFCGDRGKVGCLMTNELKGDYICAKKVFYTEEDTFEDLYHIVAFGKDEIVNDPVEVHKLLDETNRLFIPGYPVDMKTFGCRVIENVPEELFKHGIEKSSSFEKVLTWLEKNIQGLSYYSLLNKNEPISFNAEHLSAAARHGQLWNASIQNAQTQISKKKVYPQYNIIAPVPEIDEGARTLLLEIIKDADLDKIFMEYLKAIHYRFFVIENKKDFAVAAKNGVVLAKGSELGSFAKLARLFDQHGTFTASIEIRQASEKLNQVDDTMSDQDYLSLLHGVRKSLMDAFGKRMYNSYIKIITEAGTDKKRFLSELLQNADDCTYSDNCVPSFKLVINGSTLIVSYNEAGFTKDNVRAITAIGESTKKLLLSGSDHSIGEKGVGFKSVFGVAESVEIHSRGFDFRLTRQMPTIPEVCEPLDNHTGTTMIFQMKQEVHSSFTPERILQLCTCLRNLKQLEILNHRISILDGENRRTITLDGRKYTFERFVRDFNVTNEEALASRNTNGKKIDPHQRIVCYISERVKGMEMFLYSGLPVLIKSNVPLIIDAPFELTTSREDILHNQWNDIVREQLYQAILDVMHTKSNTGLDVLRYVGFRSQNNITTWQNFDDDYLNKFNWRTALQESAILPVLGSDKVISAAREKCLLIPEFIARLQAYEDVSGFFDGVVIDTIGKNQYAPLLEAIECKKAGGADILRFLSEKTEKYIVDKEFRDGLYAYLSNNQGNTVFEISRSAATSLPIFPVKTSNETRYIVYSHNIYTHKSKESREDYYILNTTILPLEQADKILNGQGRINELTQEVFDAKYQKTLQNYIENKHQQHTPEQIAAYVLGEFRNNREVFSKCKNVLLGLLPKIPFQMVNGNYKCGRKFLNSRDQWYVGTLIKTMVVSEKYKELAKFLGCTEVETMHYDDIDFKVKDISDDDIEDLQCDFVNFYEIITNLIKQGMISDEQIAKYHLEFGVGGNPGGGDDPYEEFPEHFVQNLSKLRSHIAEKWKKNPNPYIEKQYIKWQPKFTLDNETYTLSMYQSVFNPYKCFCQMCQRLTHVRYVERNDIEKKPAYAWEQMYLNLCLECSKDYKLLRNNEVIWQQFVESIMSADVIKEGAITIPIGGESITFTATHLAEVQEIFKNEGWGKNAPVRKPILGSTTENDEEGVHLILRSGVTPKAQDTVHSSPLVSFFNNLGFETIDQRKKGGALWVIGETFELKDAVKEAVRLYKVSGIYSSGNATRFRPGWCTKDNK